MYTLSVCGTTDRLAPTAWACHSGCAEPPRQVTVLFTADRLFLSVRLLTFSGRALCAFDRLSQRKFVIWQYVRCDNVQCISSHWL